MCVCVCVCVRARARACVCVCVVVVVVVVVIVGLIHHAEFTLVLPREINMQFYLSKPPVTIKQRSLQYRYEQVGYSLIEVIF